MIIDFHTHCFPDEIARKAIPKLAKIGNITPYTDGTLQNNLQRMKENGIDKAVVFNIATNPKQQKNVNTFAIQVNQTQSDLIAFGSVHPDSTICDIKNELRRLKENGVKGIKLHPDYMETTIDDEKFKPIFETCIELDLLVAIHAGWDFISPDFVYATPARIAKVIAAYPDLKLIAAHMGGNRLWDEVEQFLIGKNIWLDTSLACLGLAPEQAKRMLQNHDPTKILFGTDLPWGDYPIVFDYLNQLDLSPACQEAIYYKNAEKLLF